MMYECPHCHRRTIPAWRRWSLGPALPTKCQSCGGYVGVPWSSMFSVIPLFLGFAAALVVESLPAKAAFIVWGLGIAILLTRRLSPLVPK